MNLPHKGHDETGDFTPSGSDKPDLSATCASVDLSNTDQPSAPSFATSWQTDSPTVSSLDLSAGEARNVSSTRPKKQSRTEEDTANTVDSHRDVTSGDASNAIDFSEIRGYDVEKEIGRGGMGVVFRARQLDLNRIVAIKMLIAEKFPSSEDLIRFRLEAEVAARIRHPNVVQVYDSGSFNRAPYLVLEWIEGGTLSDVLRGGKKLQPKTAMRLISLLAKAIHHAHCNGVIHRDLKPANILLARTDNVSTKHSVNSVATSNTFQRSSPGVLLDGEGDLHLVVPKVTDFGLAKLTVGSTGLTETGRVMGTPEYMSPEQALGQTKDVGPPADIHALGVMLYQMLCGETPFRAETKIAIIKKVVDEEVKPTALIKEGISRDLQTVCLKCLQKKPDDRYPTAAEFAEDLDALLEDRPIKARPAGRLERIWKLAKRNPAISSLTAASIVLFLIGFAGVTWQWRRAESQKIRAIQAEGEAVRHAKTSDAINGFLIEEMLARATPEKALGREITVAEVLRDANERIEGAFQNEPNVEAGVQLALGRSYRSLGKPAKAVSLLQKAYDTRVKLLGPAHPDTLNAARELAISLDDDGKLPEANALFEQSTQAAVDALGPEHPATLILKSAFGLSKHLHGKTDEAIPILLGVLEVQKKTLEEKHLATLKTMNALGYVYYERKDYVEAEKLLRAAYEGRRDLLSEKHPDTLESRNNVAAVLEADGKSEEAQKIYKEILDLSKKVRGLEHIDTLSAMNNLAECYRHNGQFPRAEPLYKEAIELGNKTLGKSNPIVLKYMHNLALLEADQNQFEAAEKLLGEVIELRKKVLPEDHRDTLKSIMDLYIIKSKTKPKEALPLLKEVFAKQKAKLGLADVDTVACITEIGNVGSKRGMNLEVKEVSEIENLLASVWTQLVEEKKDNSWSAGQLADRLSRYEIGSSLNGDPKRESARKHQQRAFEILSALSANKPEQLYSLAIANTTVLRITDRQNNPTEPKSTDGLKAALKPALVAVEAAKKLDAKAAQPLLSQAWSTAGDIAMEIGEYQIALEQYRPLYEYQSTSNAGSSQEALSANLFGRCLTKLGRFEEAEPLLIKGYNLLSQCLENLPDVDKNGRQGNFLKERKSIAKQDIIALYTAMGNAEKANAWQAKPE